MSEEEKLEAQAEEVIETEDAVEENAEETVEITDEEEVVTKLPAKKQRSKKKKVETTQEAKPESEWKEQVVQIRRVT